MEKYEYKLLKYVCSSLDYEIFILTFNTIVYSFFLCIFFLFFFSVHKYFELLNYSIFYRVILETFEDKRLKFMD